jgi:Holliday junction resolvase
MNSKKKGSRNERGIANLFKAWTGYEFARTPGSGGLHWKRTSDTVGDITCSDAKHNRYFQFSVEAKNYKDINFEHLLLPVKNVKILEFWDQAMGDALEANKVPLLFMRYNGMAKDSHFLVVKTDFYTIIKSELPKHDRIQSYCKGKPIVILLSDVLFSTDYKTIHSLAKQYRKHGKQN